MLLDPLVTVIETLQRRIHEHGDSLRQNEYRTRMALIDPLLQALGWDVANPGLVTPEYDVSGQRADYALLKDSGGPATFVEAKKLGESLMPHRLQMVNYANMSGVPYAGLTDGNNWELYVVFDQKPLPERLILDLSIANLPAIQLALKFLLLWRPNLATGQPVAASAPILSEPTSPVPSPPVKPDPDLVVPDGWVTLADFTPLTGTKPPSEIRFPDDSHKPVMKWFLVQERTVEWLWEKGLLTLSKVPVQLGTKTNGRYIVHTTPQHPTGPFKRANSIDGTPLFVEGNVSGRSSTQNAKKLLTHCGQDPASVWLKVS